MTNPRMNDVGTGYLLWLGCLFQLHGLHRFYNKQYLSGFLWLFTFGFLWMGQFVDLFLMPQMVDKHNQKIRGLLGYSPTGIPLTGGEIALNASPVSSDLLMVKLTRSAAKNGGKISVTQAVMDTGVSFVQVESVLQQMVNIGYVQVDNDPKTGIVLYHFIELQ